MRAIRCPALEDDDRAMIRHRISRETCLRRQKALYHRCHHCPRARGLVYHPPVPAR